MLFGPLKGGMKQSNLLKIKPPWRAALMLKNEIFLKKLFCLSETFIDFVPVHNVPPGFQVIGPAVLVLQVISVLPHVVAQDGEIAVAQGIVLVGGRSHFELSALGAHQPRPAAAKLPKACLFKSLLEFVEAAQG